MGLKISVAVVVLLAGVALISQSPEGEQGTDQTLDANREFRQESAALDSLSETNDRTEADKIAIEFNASTGTARLVRLIGTIVSEPQEDSIALVAHPGNPEGKSYKIGDELPDGSLLQGIYENEAHVEFEGETRILFLEGFDGEIDAAVPVPVTPPDAGWKGNYEDATYNDQTEDD